MGAVTPETFRVTLQWNKSDCILLHLVGLLFNMNYDARNQELKIPTSLFACYSYHKDKRAKPRESSNKMVVHRSATPPMSILLWEKFFRLSPVCFFAGLRYDTEHCMQFVWLSGTMQCQLPPKFLCGSWSASQNNTRRKQDKQCTYNVTLRHVRATIVVVEKQ